MTDEEIEDLISRYTMIKDRKNSTFKEKLGIVTGKQRIDRRRIKELMDDTINKLEEEIEDARSDGDLAKKRRLGEAKRMLERRRAKIVVGQTIAAR